MNKELPSRFRMPFSFFKKIVAVIILPHQSILPDKTDKKNLSMKSIIQMKKPQTITQMVHKKKT